MLSKMSQPNSAGGGGGGAGAASSSGRRLPLSLSSGSTVSRLQQPGSSTNGRSNSPQTGNSSKKVTEQTVSAAAASGPFVSLKKTNSSQLRSSSTSSSSSAKDEERNNQNGVQKSSTNGKEKISQHSGGNAASTAAATKDQKDQKPKEKVTEKKESAKPASQELEKPKFSQKDFKKSPAEAAPIPAPESVDDDVIVVLDDTEPSAVSPQLPTTPTTERKSTRKTTSQKSPILPKQGTGSASASPQQQKKQQQPTEIVAAAPAIDVDTEMEPLTVDASPIRKPIESDSQNAQPAATSTPGRNLFGFRASSKQINEVELAAQSSISPAAATPRTFAQISGRRSIRPVHNFTPSKAGTYRCISNDLDTSNCTNVSMNATVGSEIPNNSSFSFSFFGRGRKRERTPPPPISGSQSANDLAQDVDMSPPKRARFEFLGLNLASPFSLLRSHFSKTTISSPSRRLHLEQTIPDGVDEDGSEVQNVSGIIVEEEQQSQQSKLNTSNEEATMGQEAGLETPKKSGSPLKETIDEKLEENQDEKDLANIAIELDISASSDTSVEPEGRSRCSIM